MSQTWVMAVASLWLVGGCRIGYEDLAKGEPGSGVGSGGGVTVANTGGTLDATGGASRGGNTATHVSGLGAAGGTTAVSASGLGAAGGTTAVSASGLGAAGGTTGSTGVRTGAGGVVAGGSGSSNMAGSGASSCRCATGQGCVNDLCTSAKIVFTTSQTFSSVFGGVSGADQICANAALSARLPGQYLAWLSDSNTDPATRFAQSTIPYALVNATVIANDWADLIDGTLAAPINLDENGQPALVAEVWSGTQLGGTRSTDTCDDWTSTSATSYGLQGVTDRVDSAWTDAYRQYCDRALIRLMCFQQ